LSSTATDFNFNNALLGKPMSWAAKIGNSVHTSTTKPAVWIGTERGPDARLEGQKFVDLRTWQNAPSRRTRAVDSFIQRKGDPARLHSNSEVREAVQPVAKLEIRGGARTIATAGPLLRTFFDDGDVPLQKGKNPERGLAIAIPVLAK